MIVLDDKKINHKDTAPVGGQAKEAWTHPLIPSLQACRQGKSASWRMGRVNTLWPSWLKKYSLGSVIPIKSGYEKMKKRFKKALTIKIKQSNSEGIEND